MTRHNSARHTNYKRAGQLQDLIDRIQVSDTPRQMARPKQERKRPAQSKPEPRDGDGKTRSNNLSVEPSKLNTESKAEPAIEPEGKSKTTTDSELVTTLGSGNDSTQLSFTQYEPQLVRQTGLYPEDKQVRLEGM